MTGIFFFSFLIFFTFKKKLSNLAKINFNERGKQIKIVNQIFGNIQDIKILLKEKFFFNKFKKNIALLKHSDFFHHLFSKVPRLIFETLAVLAIVSVIIFYMYNDRSIQDLLPLLALFGMCALRLIPSFNQILLGFSALKKSRVSFESIVKEFNEIKNNSYQIKLSDNLKNKNLISNNIIIKNVSYKYQNTDKFVLKDINIEIKKNSSIGIIGKTGCGKSTLIKIILGLLEPTSGKILADGKDIKNDLNAWYKNLSYVPQSVYLNDDSIKTNIAIGENENEISEEKILRTIELAGLKNFISSLPNKLNTKVGSQGIRLSGGQIQRIGIARALYTEPNIFILDEATSSLDRKTEDEVINDFFKLKKNNFSIIVSHRLSSLKFCNEVFFIKDGKIKDRGKIDDLILRNQDISK
jgi:ATP-binding cassette subfamily C protein